MTNPRASCDQRHSSAEPENDGEKLPLSVTGVIQPEGSSKHARIGKVIDHITENFAEEISVDTAANMADMSASSFSRNFQRLTGKTFVDFVNRVRISQACSMLYNTDQQISAICYSVGFKNIANFNRHFLKMKDMTPKAFRELALSELIPTDSAE